MNNNNNDVVNAVFDVVVFFLLNLENYIFIFFFCWLDV